jgi:hypothetical protein
MDVIPHLSCRQRLDPFSARLPGKKRLIPVFSLHFSRNFFTGFLTSFFNSELPGTIFAYLEVLGTIPFFKNFQTPYFGPGRTKITGQFPDWR